VVAADVAWRARDGVELDLADSLTPIAATLFGDDAGARRQFVALMRALCDAQRQLLIFGNYSGAPVPPGGYTGDGENTNAKIRNVAESVVVLFVKRCYEAKRNGVYRGLGHVAGLAAISNCRNSTIAFIPSDPTGHCAIRIGLVAARQHEPDDGARSPVARTRRTLVVCVCVCVWHMLIRFLYTTLLFHFFATHFCQHVPFFQSPSYVSVVRPLLRAMTLQFGALAPQFAALLPHAVAAESG
jgi:hypothetical protein